MKTRRNIVDPFGCEIALEVTPEGMILSCFGDEGGITLDEREAMIFKAMIDHALSIRHRESKIEDLTGGKRVALHMHDAPVIVVEDSLRRMEIHPPSWVPLSCEVALLIPRIGLRK